MIKRTIISRDIHILLNLYKTLVRPHWEYCSPAWSPHYQKDKQILEKVQHRFTRLFPDLRNICYQDRLRRLGLWSLQERRDRADLLEVFKLKAGLSNVTFHTYFDRNLHSRTRGHSWKITKNRSKLDIRKYFFSERAVNRWNKLSQDDVDQTMVNAFKKSIGKKTFSQDGLLRGLMSAKSLWPHLLLLLPGKLPGEFYFESRNRVNWYSYGCHHISYGCFRGRFSLLTVVTYLRQLDYETVSINPVNCN